jgi:hypothetical protein
MAAKSSGDSQYSEGSRVGQYDYHVGRVRKIPTENRAELCKNRHDLL